MFSGEGGFLGQIGKSGNGPGEYRQITGLAVDPRKNRIYIASGRKVLCFDSDNHLLYEKQLPSDPVHRDSTGTGYFQGIAVFR